MTEADESPNLRALIAPYTEWASEKLHEKFPNLEADHLSFLGAALVASGSLIAASPFKRPARLAFPLIVAGVVTDTFNGALAKVCYGDDPDRLVRGNQVDSASDLAKDLSMGMSKIMASGRRQDRVSQSLAEIATITTPLASFSRAYKEKRGYQINEHGGSYLEFLGTRAGRTALHAVASSNIVFNEMPIQPALDAITIIANLTRVVSNMTASVKEEKSPAASQKAQFRTRFHGASIAITGGGIAMARKLLPRPI